MKATVFSVTGEKKGQVELPNTVFGVEPNSDQLKLAYNRYFDNIRTNNAKTLKRGEVSGGGRKPWKQKGTGRARFGSSRNPIWRHGGIAFGPTGDENYTKNMPKKMLRSSVAQALSLKSKDIMLVESFQVKEYKTKNIVNMLDKIGIDGSVLITASVMDEKFINSARNISGVTLISLDQLNVAAVLNSDSILIDKEGIKQLEVWLNIKSKKANNSKRPDKKNEEAKK